MQKNTTSTIFIIFILTGFFTISTCFCQEVKKNKNLSGAISVTNNGISLIPSFSLGKPAAIFDFSLHNSRWSFDPQLRFSLEGKPWTFIFWGRYKLINKSKFNLTLGAHPAINFKEENLLEPSGISRTVLNATRYTATEIVPNYNINQNISIGLYYLDSHGWDVGTLGNTHFMMLNSSIKNIKITETYLLKWQPQAFYLKTDAKDGIYAASILTISSKKIPFTVSYLINKKIKSEINSADFLWNLSLTYLY